ncbi:hypothetical protein VTO42DRAFT_4831 [Malbranchea cinnamomea]
MFSSSDQQHWCGEAFSSSDCSFYGRVIKFLIISMLIVDDRPPTELSWSLEHARAVCVWGVDSVTQPTGHQQGRIMVILDVS